MQQKHKLLLPAEMCGHKLIQDVATRWNSTLEMIQRLSEQAAALHATALDGALGKKGQDLQTKLYSFRDQVTVDAIVCVLQPFTTATLSMDKEPTHHLLVATVIKLNKALQQNDETQLLLHI